MNQCVVFEEKVNLYADGELDHGQHSRMFAHLAGCGTCRNMLESVIRLRRIIGDDRMIVPPTADVALFRRVAALKASAKVSERLHRRDPVWNLRSSISTRTALVAASVVFLFGLAFGSLSVERTVYAVEGTQESITFEADVSVRPNPVYVFYPGLTVEAERVDP